MVGFGEIKTGGNEGYRSSKRVAKDGIATTLDGSGIEIGFMSSTAANSCRTESWRRNERKGGSKGGCTSRSGRARYSSGG